MSDIFRLGLRVASDAERRAYDIDATDVAVFVFVSGEPVAWTDDYGTATLTDSYAGTLQAEALKEAVEVFVEKATDVWAAATSSPITRRTREQ